MSTKATVIACVNQKGGTGKTTTCENLDFRQSRCRENIEELPVTITDMMK